MQYTKLIKDIPEYKNWTKIELINKGWSHDIKYYIEDNLGRRMVNPLTSYQLTNL